MDCCFDSLAYAGAPDTSPCPQAFDLPERIAELDALNASGREDEAQARLELWLAEARSVGDWRAELSLLSELLGQYRRSLDSKKGLLTVEAALALIRAHGLGSTLSGATVMLNAATTLKCFGQAAASLPIFEHVCRVYAARLDPGDYRFAGLYNNMALSCADAGDAESAERCYKLALQVLETCGEQGNDAAVTLCNMAELYDGLDAEDPRIGDCIERAWQALCSPTLPRDGYHAFTLSKCAPCFDRLGFFLYAREARERVRAIYERT